MGPKVKPSEFGAIANGTDGKVVWEYDGRKATGKGIYVCATARAGTMYMSKLLNEMGYKTGFAVKIKSLHLFGSKETDGWGYPSEWLPEKSGHSDIWHPILINGDDPEQIDLFMESGEYELLG